MRKYYYILLFLLALSCDSEDVSNTIIIDQTSKVKATFKDSFVRMTEGDIQDVQINLSRKSEEGGFIELKVTSDALPNIDFTTMPEISTDGVINLSFATGDSTLNFNIASLVDNDDDTESLELSISASSDNLNITESGELTIEITDPATSEEELTIVTWNIENFPLNGSTTINTVIDIIENMDADVIALQEMDEISAFNTLVNSLDGWEGQIEDVRGGIELAYLYKTSEINSFSTLSTIYNDDRSAFPRQPVLTTITHVSGLEVTLINIHLKCCGVTGSEDANRREAASERLEDYIDNNLATDNVVVLGDYNDDISDGPFDNFLDNSENYLFADFEIGEGDSDNWSYPSWPSHLDHILITNELFDNLVKTETLKLDQEVSSYLTQVSDHRPVAATFSN